MIVVADLHQLMKRVNEVYQLDGAKSLERKGMKVEQSYVDQVNRDSKTNGKMFVVDKDATKEFEAATAVHVENLKDDASKRKLGLTETAEALINKAGKEKKTRRTKAQIEADKKAEEQGS